MLTNSLKFEITDEDKTEILKRWKTTDNRELIDISVNYAFEKLNKLVLEQSQFCSNTSVGITGTVS